MLVDGLVERRILSLPVVSAAVADATTGGRTIVAALRDRGALDDRGLRDAVAAVFGLPIAQINNAAIRYVADFPASLARMHGFLPLGVEDDKLVLALADPTRASAIRAARCAAGRTLDLRVAALDDLTRAVQDVYAPRLTVKLAGHKKVRFALPLGDLTIGRATHCGIVLDDGSTSATHAVFRGDGDSYSVVDLGSRNGVFVNGERIVEARELHHKDHVRIGAARITFKWPHQRRRIRGEDAAAGSVSSKRSYRMRRAWITFAGRVIAKVLGAAALIFLGLALTGGLPQSCSTPSTETISSATGED